MSSSVLSIIFITLLIVIEFISDIFIKKYTLHQIGNVALIISFFVYAIGFILWILAMKVELFSKVVNYYALLSILGGSILGYLVFRDKLSPINISGIILALVSIVLISL